MTLYKTDFTVAVDHGVKDDTVLQEAVDYVQGELKVLATRLETFLAVMLADHAAKQRALVSIEID